MAALRFLADAQKTSWALLWLPSLVNSGLEGCLVLRDSTKSPIRSEPLGGCGL